MQPWSKYLDSRQLLAVTGYFTPLPVDARTTSIVTTGVDPFGMPVRRRQPGDDKFPWLGYCDVAVTFRKGVTPGLPFRRPASTVAALVH